MTVREPSGRIDVHHHAILPEIAELMRRRGVPFAIPWSLDETREVMTASRVDFAMISNAIPGDFFESWEQAAPFYRSANEAVAAFVADRSDEFGLLAALPMPHVDAALDEAAHAYDVLGADGVVLVPHAGTDYLGDAAFEPLLDELDRRHAVVLVHPMALPSAASTSVPYVLADFLLDTTRGAISMIMSETLDRYPNISFVLSHAGGFLPYAAMRIETLGDGFFDIDPARVHEYIGRFHYDTALAGRSALRALFDVVDPQQVVYGSDWCAAPRPAVHAATEALDLVSAELSPVQRNSIDSTNAARLFGRVRQGAHARAGAPVA